MNRLLIVAMMLFFGSVHPVAAVTDTLIEVELERQKGGQPVVLRAILSTPDSAPPKTVLLFFRGGHGIPHIKSVEDRRTNYAPFITNFSSFFQAGIALATVDCPTDEWGPVEGNRASTCLDTTYRSTPRHADDVRKLLARLRQDYGFTRIFIMGHSKGTLSSRWLAANLGKEIEGSIHSASMSQADPWGNGITLRSLPYERITAPTVWMHHENDACVSTKYSDAKMRAGDRLITVRGGTPQGDVCSTHYHGYTGRGREAVDAVITWINTGKVEAFVGTP